MHVEHKRLAQEWHGDGDGDGDGMGMGIAQEWHGDDAGQSCQLTNMLIANKLCWAQYIVAAHH